MARLIDLEVDGLITDYPDHGLRVLAQKGLAFRLKARRCPPSL